MADLPQSARRFRDRALAAGLRAEIVELSASARTAEEAAGACGCSVAQIVKSLVYVGGESGRPYLLLVSGANRVDEAAIAAELGEALRRPNGKEVREMTGYAIGGIPPLGHDAEMVRLMDADLMQHDVVWAAAGTPHCVFPVEPAALAEAAGARIVGFRAAADG